MMYPLLKQLLFSLNPETAHEAVKMFASLLPTRIMRLLTRPTHPALKTRFGTAELASPIGLAAGFDKNAEMLPLTEALGFAFTELGSVTLHACPGNPKPRIFRLPADDSLINWMGLPNVGVDKFIANLKRNRVAIPYGINIAKTPDVVFTAMGVKPEDGIAEFRAVYRQIHAYGFYTVFNLSCPNTGEGRTFEDPGLFAELAYELARARKSLKDGKPVLVKLSPDVEEKQLKRLVKTALEEGFDGFVIGNTTRSRPRCKTSLTGEWKTRGGLSGRLLGKLAGAQLRRVRTLAGTNPLLIACGGVMNFDDVVDRLDGGANLVQIYTGLIYGGPLFVWNLNKRLAR